MKKLFQLNEEVGVNQDNFISIDHKLIDSIKLRAQNNKSGKYRICIHSSDQDNVHEMLIVHKDKTYVRPHKHSKNGESLQFIHGTATAVFFNDDGSINNYFDVGDLDSGNIFYYSISKGLFHTLLIRSEFLIFKETTKGPFIREDTKFPLWAPDGSNQNEVDNYLEKLKNITKASF